MIISAAGRVRLRMRMSRKRRHSLVDVKTREQEFDLAALRASAPDLAWYALNVEAQKEFTASLILRRRGFQTFLPTRTDFRKRTRYSDHKEEFSYALIPRFLFIGFGRDAVPRWLDVFALQLVHGVIGRRGQPSIVPASGVVDLMDRWAANHFRAPECQKSMRSGKEFKIGDMVQVAEGPLKLHCARVENITKKAAIVVIDIFNSQQRAEIPLDILEIMA